MTHINLRIAFVLAMGLFIEGCNSQKQQPPEPVTTTIIVTPVPVAKEIAVVPVGYTTCFTVEGGFYQKVWVPAHRICQYETVNGKATWVDGYWACTRYDIANHGVCRHWLWKSAHWTSSTIVY